jgi:hypothetical protein
MEPQKAHKPENTMTYSTTQRLSLSSLAIACLLAFTINGSLLMGFDHLAHAPAAACANGTSQLAGAESSAGQLAL